MFPGSPYISEEGGAGPATQSLQGRIQDFEIGGSSIHHARETRPLGGSGGMPPQKNVGIQAFRDRF